MPFDPITGELITTPSQLEGGPIVSPYQVDAPAPLGMPDIVTPEGWGGMGAPQDPYAPQLAAASEKVSGSQGVKFRGVTEEGRKATGDIFDRAAAEADANYAEQGQRFVAEAQATNQHYADQTKAILDGGEAERQHYGRMSQLAREVRDFNRTNAELEERIHQDGEVVRNQILSEYREQLAGVKALSATTGNPLAGLSGTQKGAVAAAMFVQGFLAVQGINIDVASQVDKWVDRSIQEHQMLINNARQDAEGTFHLYEIARQSSKDDWEARQRYRGFVIEGFQAAIQVEAARFGSEVAVSRAQQKTAELNILRDANLGAIGDRAYTAYTTEHNNARLDAVARANAAIQTREANISAMNARTARMAEERAAKKQAAETTEAPPNWNIADPEYLTNEDGSEVTDAQGNRVIMDRWQVDDSLPAPVKAQVHAEAREVQKNYGQYLSATTKMIGTYEKAKEKFDAMPAAVRALGYEKAARYDDSGAIDLYLKDRIEWVDAKVLADSGKAATDVERSRKEELAALDKVLQVGTRGKQLYANLRDTGRVKFERNMQIPGIIVKETPTGKRAAKASPTAAAQDSINRGDFAGVKVEKGLASTSQEHIEARDSEEVETKKISGLWADHDREQTAAGVKMPIGQPEYGVYIDRLAIGILDPDNEANKAALGIRKEESHHTTLTDSWTVLDAVANGETKAPRGAAEYAKMVRDAITKDRDAARKRLSWRP